MFSSFKRLTTRMTWAALALPALLVTLASLAALVSSAIISASASRPDDLLYRFRQPALGLQLALTRDPQERAAIKLQIGPEAPPDDDAAAGEVFEGTGNSDRGDGPNNRQVKEATGQGDIEDRSVADGGEVDADPGRSDGAIGQLVEEDRSGTDHSGEVDESNEGGGAAGQADDGEGSGAGGGEDGKEDNGGTGDGSGGDGSADSSEDAQSDDQGNGGDDGDHSGPDEEDEDEEEDDEGDSQESDGEDDSEPGDDD